MDLNKFGNFNWIEMNSKDQNLDLTQIKRIHFCPFQFIFVCWVYKLEISPVNKNESKWTEMDSFVSNPDSDLLNPFLSN